MVIACIASLFNCARHPAASPVAADDVELTVAASALGDFVDDSDDDVILLNRELVARTAGFPDSAAWTQGMDAFGIERTRYPALIGAYWRANRRPRALEAALPVSGRPVQLVDESESRFASKTVHVVSRVGFSRTGDSAIVAVDASCGMLCGRGVLALYVLEPAGWRLASLLQILQY